MLEIMNLYYRFRELKMDVIVGLLGSKSLEVVFPSLKGLSLKFISPMLPSVIALTGFSPVGSECSCVHI